MLYLLLYYVVVNLLLFGMMGIDKSRAKKNAWRIPEAYLFMVSLLGGALGGFLGMFAFHHKKKKIYFYFIYFISLNLHFIILYLLLGKLFL